MSEFFQDGPRLGNQYDEDAFLRSYLRWRLPSGLAVEIEPELHAFGGRVATDILALGDAAESAPPRHVPYDPWGRRIDDIVVSDAWRALDRIAAQEGLIAIAYERAHGEHSRVHQMAKLFLFHPSSATYSCPLAMADGAARLLELHGDARTRGTFERLTTRDPERFWTSGQWMTERTGGSDVAGTSTLAQLDDDGVHYRLSGTKWFTSATTSQMAIGLARIVGAPEGNRGLSVFLIELRDESGGLRGISVNRLKDKLGTRALPTAELTLSGAPAVLVGGAGHGVRRIATMFNVTRVYNAVAAVGGMRRAVALARDYATRRTAFGARLSEQPLHVETLAELEARTRASFMLAFQVVELLGREEGGVASDDDLAQLRVLTPIAKLYTAKQAVAVASEALEAFGGAGYIEDTGVPRLLRDAQVLPIWEGTTNVLSLDMWRAIERTNGLDVWAAGVHERMRSVATPPLRAGASRVVEAAGRIVRYVARERESGDRDTGARRLAFAIARTASAERMLDHAEWCARAGDSDRDAGALAIRWSERDLTPGLT